MKAALAISFALLAACAPTGAPPPPPGSALADSASAGGTDAEVEKAGAAALAGFIDTWNRAATGDERAPIQYGELYWPDAELVDPSGRIWDSRASIERMHVDLWRTAFKGSTVRGSVRRVRRLSPTLMIADLDLELAAFRTLPSGAKEANGVVRTRLKHVMEKRSGAWKVLASQNTFVSDAPTK